MLVGVLSYEQNFGYLMYIGNEIVPMHLHRDYFIRHEIRIPVINQSIFHGSCHFSGFFERCRCCTMIPTQTATQGEKPQKTAKNCDWFGKVDMDPSEPRKKPWLVGLYIGDYSTQLYGDYKKNITRIYKDPY